MPASLTATVELQLEMSWSERLLRHAKAFHSALLRSLILGLSLTGMVSFAEAQSASERARDAAARDVLKRDSIAKAELAVASKKETIGPAYSLWARVAGSTGSCSTELGEASPADSGDRYAVDASYVESIVTRGQQDATLWNAMFAEAVADSRQIERARCVAFLWYSSAMRSPNAVAVARTILSSPLVERNEAKSPAIAYLISFGTMVMSYRNLSRIDFRLLKDKAMAAASRLEGGAEARAQLASLTSEREVALLFLPQGVTPQPAQAPSIRAFSPAISGVTIELPAGASIERVLADSGVVPLLLAFAVQGVPLEGAKSPGTDVEIGTRLRALYQIVNLLLVRVMSPNESVRRLEFESSLLTQFVLRRCINAQASACMDALYPALRMTKGMMPLALGSTIPVSDGSIGTLTQSAEDEIADGGRRWLKRVSDRQSIDSTSQAMLWETIARHLPPEPSWPRTTASSDTELEEAEAFVDFYRYLSTDSIPRPMYGAFIQIARREPTFVALGSQLDIDNAVELLVRSSTTTGRSWTVEARRVRELVWARIDAALARETRRVIVAPDGYVHRIPWPLLVPQDGRELHIVASWDQFARRRRRPPAAPTRLMLSLEATTFPAWPGVEPIAVRPDLSPLFDSTGWEREAMPETSVTPKGIKAKLDGAQILHLISHGVAPAKGSSSSQTGVTDNLEATRLALPDSSGSDLTAAEVATWDMRQLALVVLAACRTGAGEVLDGQGVLGFPAALGAADPRTAVLSLWPAPNGPSTEVLLEEFYRGVVIERMTIERALEAARRRVRESYPHPYHWAGWVSIGESWRGLR